MNTTSTNEVNLIRALQNHCSDSFSTLYEAYSPALYGVLIRLVNDPVQAEDLLQDAFIKIWSNSHNYDPKQGRLFTWLLTITRNLALDELRSRKIRTAASAYIYERSEELMNPSRPEGSPEKSLLSPLAPKYRIVVELMYYQNYTTQEVADTLKLPIGTVKTHVRTALQQLKTFFRQDIYHYQTSHQD